MPAATQPKDPFPNSSIRHESLHTVSFVQPFLASSSSVLDIGCGEGFVAWQLAQGFAGEVCCVDIGDFRRVQTPHFLLYDGISLPFADKRFDVTLLAFVLHHLPDMLKPLLLQEVKRVTLNTVVLLEDKPQNPLDRLVSWSHGNSYRRKIGSRERFGFLTKEEWEGLFPRLGFSLVESRRLGRLCRSVWQPFSRSVFILKTQ